MRRNIASLADARRRGELARIKEKAAKAGIPLSDHVVWLLENAARWLPAAGARERRALAYHRRCLALLRLGRSIDEAEREATAIVGRDRGGRRARGDGFAAVV